MDSPWKTNKINFVSLEVLGTAFMTYAYSINPILTYSSFIFAATIWSWQLSAAHFNPALTLGSLLFDPSNFVTNLVPALATIVC